MRIVTSLDRWIVTLTSGAKLDIWADAFSEDGNAYVFKVLIDRENDEPGLGAAEIVDRTPGNPSRVTLATARIPAAAVSSVVSA